MTAPASRQNLIDYCLRRLGHPVIEINIDDDQIEDRIDDALQFWREYHFDGTELTYLKAEITPSTMTLASFVGTLFTVGETLTGQSSGATAKVLSKTSSTSIKIDVLTGTFTGGETVTGGTSGISGALAASNPVSLGVIDNKYFEISDSVIGITRVFPFSNRANGMNMFDIRYQILLNDMYSLMSTDLIYYSQVKTQLELINQLLVGQKPIRYNRHMNRLYVDMDWEADGVVGDYMIVECYRILDPDTFTDVYNDMFLKRYATALIKRQWGENLKKFAGVQLPGGVTLNGVVIYQEAIDEITNLESEMQSKYEIPPEFITG